VAQANDSLTGQGQHCKVYDAEILIDMTAIKSLLLTWAKWD